MPKSMLRLCFLLIVLVLPGQLTAAQTQLQLPGNGPTLSAILSRGELNCGLNQDLQGFGYLDPNTGEVRGFDVDFCRALAAAVLGDASAMNPVLYTTEGGLTALQAGDIDVLYHNVTWTLTQDAVENVVFGPPNFFNGQSLMTRRDSTFLTWETLDGATICLVNGSTAQQEIDYALTHRGLFYQLDTFATLNEAEQAFIQGQCDALSAGRLELELLRQENPSPESYMVWDDMYTREPFAPVIRAGDDQWNNIVTWLEFGLMTAEANGILSTNVDDMLRTAGEGDADYTARVGPEAARLLDPTLGIGARLGLSNNFMVTVIREVGNYAEIYDRNLGSGRLALNRAFNALWENGGWFYFPDWR